MKPMEKTVRTGAALLMAAAVIAGGIEMGAPGTPAAVASATPEPYWKDAEMPEYPGSLEYPLGDDLAVNGVPLLMSYFESDDAPARIRDHYVEAFDRAGLEARVTPGENDAWTVAALAADARHEYVVAVLPQGRRTFVFPSLVPVASTGGEPRSPISANELPLSDEAVGVMQVSSSEGGGVVTWHEPQAPYGAAAMRVRDEMGRRGWQLLEYSTPPGGNRSIVAHFRRGVRQAQFTVSARPGEPVGAVIVAQYSNEED